MAKSEPTNIADLMEIMANQQSTLNELVTALTLREAGKSSSVPGSHFARFDDEVETFDDYLDRLNSYFRAHRVKDEDKANTFVSMLSPKHHSLLKSLVFPSSCESKSYEHLTTVLRNHLSPQPLIIPSRHAFLNRKQREGECVSMYMSELRRLAVNCKYENNMLDTMLRDVFVSGLRSKPMLDRLFEEDDIPLKKTLELASAIERATEGTSEILHTSEPRSSLAINKVQASNSKSSSRKRKNRKNTTATAKPNTTIVCFKCGVHNNHKAPECKAKNLHCGFCSMAGHVEKVCMRKKKIDVKHVDNGDSDADTLCSLQDDLPFANSYHIHNVKSQTCPPMLITVNINKIPVQLELDSGSKYTIINWKTFTKVSSGEELSTTSEVLRTYDGSYIKPVGIANFAVTYRGVTKILSTIVVEKDYPLLFGRKWMEAFGITFNNVHVVNASTASPSYDFLLTKYNSVFSDQVGAIKKFTCTLQLKEGATPIYQKARPVPLALRGRIENELQRLVEAGVLEPVETSDWATPVVPVVKPSGDIRLCGDYSGTVNRQVAVTQHPFPGFEEAFSKLSGGQLFTRLDVRSAFLHVPVSKETSHVLTINTHCGLFRPQRLMYGVSPAPAVWQRYIDSLFKPIKCCFVHDDVIIPRSHVYWPRIDIDIERMVKNCRACQLGAKEPAKVPTHFWERPCHPWQRIHLDFAGPFQNVTYFLVIDAYSKWPEVFPVKNTSSTTTIHILSELFARFGLPVCAVSDNASTFTSKDFQQYMAKNGIRHITGAPYHPSTNGQVERYVQTLKKALKALADSPGTPAEKLCTFLMTYRRAPHSSTGQSPSKMMLNREIRSALDILRPTVKSSPPVQEVKQKAFVPGEKVALRAYTSPNRKWEFGKVLNRDGDLTYSLIVDGAVKRRHVDQMRSVGQNLELAPPTYGTIPTPSQAPTSPRHSVAPGGASLGGGQEPISSPVLTDGPPSSGPLPRLPSSGNTSGGLPEPPAGETLRKSSSARPAGLRRYPQRVRKIPQRLNL
ncbi:Hypothetical Protein NTJ_09819 [Nesidiocoris tenuis]|uniref:Integrase catalytic domain-containing protein n=1 Tax=Nesidiocoris tenuis TaxID=355587 RepID=A0ABN7B1G5_9HEMI|nr:Hypothetical Protein NTJ_09819 [Nesidiocoris tenuis]